MNGELFEWYDETLENPWVIKKGRVVQPEIIEEERKKQIQKQKDTQAIANAQKEMTKEPEDRVSKLEKKVEEQDNKLDKILEKLS